MVTVTFVSSGLVQVYVTVVIGVGTFEFSLASYNILAQDLLEEHSYMYTHCDAQCLRWSYRRQNIMRQLNKHNPDVCLHFLLYFISVSNI